MWAFLPGWLRRTLGWLLAALAAVGAILGYGRLKRAEGLRDGRQHEELQQRRESDDARRRMDEADVPRSRRDLIDRLRNR